MGKLWLIYVIVSTIDLTLTLLLLNPSTEGNAIAVIVWSNLGSNGLILYKILIVSLFIFPVCKYIEKRNLLLCKRLLMFGIITTSITCLFFIGVIL